MKNLPFLTVHDPIGSSEGSLDPLGLYLIADQLAMKLVPGIRERMIRVRFLTAMTVGAFVTEGLEANPRHPEVPPFIVWEWLVVEAMIRSYADDPDQNLWGLPGSLVVHRAINNYNYVDYRSYLKTPTVFGFHGVYKRLAVYLGLLNTQLSICEGRGLELIERWSRGQGLGDFTHSHELYETWRKAVASSLTRTPVRTAPYWSQDQWRQLANLFLPHGASRVEKTCLKKMLLSEKTGQMGAFKDIWDYCSEIDHNDIDEKVIHQALKKRAPHHGVLVTAIRAYEHFCRVLTDAFTILRYIASSADISGCSLAIVEKDQPFQNLATHCHTVFEEAANRLSDVAPDMEERFRARFIRFSEPMTVGAFPKALCEHHEWIQQNKSNEGKRAWFDRIGPNIINIRTNYRVPKPPEISDQFVHEYRTKPIVRFYRDLT